MAEPEPEEEQRVSRIMSESEDPDYWFAASKDGNRAGHYRGAHLILSLLLSIFILNFLQCTHVP